jgi:hypothetical protein
MSPRLRTTPRTVAACVALAAAAALALSGCAASKSTSSTPAGSSSEVGPGVTADSIKVGFAFLNKATSAGGGGFVIPDRGDAEAQIDAMVKYVNANGGIGGRKIIPVKRKFESSTDSPQTENALCSGFTNDDKVFAVVLVGQRSPSARTCYQKADTLMIDVGGNSFSNTVFNDLKPYFWSPDTVDFDTDLKALVPRLKAQGFFDNNAKVGVVEEKSPTYQALVNDVLKPAVTAAGSTVSQVVDIDQSTPDAAGSTSISAVSTLKNANVNAVIFVGRADNSGYFTGTAFPQKYFPRLSITTFEDPQFLIDNPAFSPPATLENAVGIGVSPVDDGVAASYPFPSTEAQKTCVNTIFKPAGITFKGLPEAKVGLRYCDATLFLQAVGNKIGASGTLNAANFQTAAFGLGSTWQASASLATSFADGVYAPASGYHDLAYSKGAFLYKGDLQTFAR